MGLACQRGAAEYREILTIVEFLRDWATSWVGDIFEQTQSSDFSRIAQGTAVSLTRLAERLSDVATHVDVDDTPHYEKVHQWVVAAILPKLEACLKESVKEPCGCAGGGCLA